MNALLKCICLVLLLSAKSFFGIAQGPLTTMPLDILIGTTKNAEIENKGICLSKVKWADSSSHCIRYSMSDDKFYAYIGPDGLVDKIAFLAISHHVLPQSWQDLGLRLASSYRYRKTQLENAAINRTVENENGNSQKEFLDIITAQHAKNIIRKTSYSSDYQIGERISFTIGSLQFDAEFIKWVKPAWCVDCATYTDYDNGLVSLDITLHIE